MGRKELGLGHELTRIRFQIRKAGTQERISDKEVKTARTTSERERGDFQRTGTLCPFPDSKYLRDLRVLRGEIEDCFGLDQTTFGFTRTDGKFRSEKRRPRMFGMAKHE